MTAYGLLLCDDFIFTSRIVGTAEVFRLVMRSAKSSAELLNFARQTPPACVIIDLSTPGLAIEVVVAELLAMTPRPFVVGYGSHVDTATLKAARDAGCDIVWPRSKFVEALPTALPEWFRREEKTA
ncbi:MAG: response regulator transcription factor [Planctomycetes bacterium]|nr:response regulator transcription factor [Planctomycetota bacterium]